MKKTRQYYSDRGLPLTYNDEPPPVATITVECYCKWYALYVVDPAGNVKEMEFPELDDYQFTFYSDHKPNLEVVALYAAKNGMMVDDLAMEMMIGRWEREYKDNYKNTYVG